MSVVKGFQQKEKAGGVFDDTPKHYAHGCLRVPEGEVKCQGSHY
jgi:hypothetical protein